MPVATNDFHYESVLVEHACPKAMPIVLSAWTSG